MKKQFYTKNVTSKRKTALPLRLSIEEIERIIQTYLKIYDAYSGKLNQWVLTESQKNMIKAISENKTTIISKARQLGVTTTLQAIATTFLIVPDTSIFYFCPNSHMCKNARDRIRLFLEGMIDLEKELFPNSDVSLFNIEQDNSSFTSLKNKSRIYFKTCHKSVLRGQNPNTVIFDECNHKQIYEVAHGGLLQTNVSRIMIAADPAEADEISEELPIQHEKLEVSQYPFKRIVAIKLKKFYAEPIFF